MNKLLVIFEDNREFAFRPLSALRPMYSLRSGMGELWSEIKSHFPGYDLALETAPHLAYLATRESGAPANQFDWSGYDRIVLFNGAAVMDEDFADQLEACDMDTSFIVDDVVGAMVLDGHGSAVADYLQISHELDKYTPFARALKNQSAHQFEYYRAIWDLMLANPDNIRRDFERLRTAQPQAFMNNQAGNLPRCHLINPDEIYIHPEASVIPGAVFDASFGPIYLERGVEVDGGSHIVGPFYAADDCRLLGGKFAGSTLGPVCQIAGELEESILQGYVNKHHAGFVGHSFVGEWVNFGAMTTNSDLKNNYSNVRVAQNGQLIDTGAAKVGSFIGDHTKFGIGTLLNTGINIGVMCNIFGGALITDKEVPSFSWGASGAWSEYDFEKALETASRAMARRGRRLGEGDVAAMRRLRDLTR